MPFINFIKIALNNNESPELTGTVFTTVRAAKLIKNIVVVAKFYSPVASEVTVTRARKATDFCMSTLLLNRHDSEIHAIGLLFDVSQCNSADY